MTDERILSLLRARAEEAIDALKAAFGQRLYSTARNILGNHQDAEESVSDTYLAVWNAIPPKQPDPLSGFVLKTGRNIALNRLRRETAQKRFSRYDLSLDELAECLPGPSLEQALDARALGRAINAFLGTLPGTGRAIFLRRYWFGDSIKEIAGAFHMTESAVSVRLSRIRSGLKAHLRKEGYYEE